MSDYDQIEEAVLKALYDALRADQTDQLIYNSADTIGKLDMRRSAIFLATKANWRKWVRP